MTGEHLVSLRGALDWLKDDVKVIKGEVDPSLEIGAIQKAFDEGPAILVENVKGYPDVRLIANMFSEQGRVARLLGVKSYAETKFKVLDAVKNPIAPVEVSEAPCQEVFIPKDEVDPFRLFPMIKHTEKDGGRFFGSGVHYISGRYAEGNSQLAFYRMSFRGKDHASINMVPGGHGDQIADKFSNEKIPCTVNICPSPAVELVATGSLMSVVFPSVDEIGCAGALQGAPVEIVKAKTVDAYAIANAEWVIEGYIVPYEREWETEEAEEIGKQGVSYFHPEWARYMGRAYRGRKFEVTGVTRRKDKPLYYVPHFGTSWGQVPLITASFYELAQRVAPGFVIDVHNFHGLTTWSGIVFQVRKRRRSDEGLQRNLLAAAMGAVRGLRLAIVVDEDINIYQPEDIFFAMTTRVNPDIDIVRGVGGRGQAYQPAERMAAGGAGAVAVSSFEGGIGIDATVPLSAKEHFQRAHYSVDSVDLKNWFSEEEMVEMKSRQSEYVRFLGEAGYA